MQEKNIFKYLLFFHKIKNIGINTILRMIDFFGSLENCFNSDFLDFKKFGFNDSIVFDILENKKSYDFENELLKYEKLNIKFISYFEENYPKRLKLVLNPPIIVFYKGNLINDDKSIAVVGSRKCTEYGVSVASDFCSFFADNNIVIVSGGALGIDSIAHNIALRNNNKTISVMGCGLDFLYPSSNKKLFEKILDTGGVIVSEFSIGMPALPQNFVMRNRIISGLSDSVFIVEAGINSGTMTTASFALEQNKNVFVVPGSIYNPYSHGTNKLIKDGAIFVTDPKDICDMVWGGYCFNNLKNDFIENKSIDCSWMSDNEKSIYNILSYKPTNLENIFLETKIPINQINSILIIFEIKGLIKNIGAMNYVKIN